LYSGGTCFIRSLRLLAHRVRLDRNPKIFGCGDVAATTKPIQKKINDAGGMITGIYKMIKPKCQ
jgi:hypothetical protein